MRIDHLQCYYTQHTDTLTNLTNLKALDLGHCGITTIQGIPPQQSPSYPEKKKKNIWQP